MFWMLDCGGAVTHSLICLEQEETLRRDGDRSHLRRRLFTKTTISHPFAITSAISFYTKKWYHFHSNEVGNTVAQHCHLPIDDYANSFKRKRDEGRKRLLEHPESSQQWRMALGFFIIRPL